MALRTSRSGVVRGAPADTGGGNNGSRRAHWASLGHWDMACEAWRPWVCSEVEASIASHS